MIYFKLLMNKIILIIIFWVVFTGAYAFAEPERVQIFGSLDNINDDMWEVRGLAGYDVHLSETLAVTPYLGLGYRHLNDNMGGKISTRGAYGYDREISYLYSPIGADITTSLENRQDKGMGLEVCLCLKRKARQ
ncbi:MAG: hypothetical protein AABY55_07275 [Candidatus Omnitrophota bacterium]